MDSVISDLRFRFSLGRAAEKPIWKSIRQTTTRKWFKSGKSTTNLHDIDFLPQFFFRLPTARQKHESVGKDEKLRFIN
jgi:hypothetical protein